MSDSDIICSAIRNKQILTFSYKGSRRTVEPHLLGYDRDGDLTLSARQLSGTGIGWRDFHVSRLSGLSTTEETFLASRAGYDGRDKTIKRVVCRL